MKTFEVWLAKQPDAVKRLANGVQREIYESEMGLLSALATERQGRRAAERLLAEAGVDMDELRPAQEARNLGQWMEAQLHLRFTVLADEMFGDGYMTREERIAFSGAIGDALTAFAERVKQDIPQVLQRPPYRYPEDDPAGLPLEEAGEMKDEFIAIEEAAVSRDGTMQLKVIQPGWGASGYYPEGVLKRDGPKVFGSGTKMYWDHPTTSEAMERPERSLRDLAAEFVEDAQYLENGPKGKGLYARAKVFKPYQDSVNELAPHIGASIRGQGRYTYGEAEGREGPIFTELVDGLSVDFVTQAGAGGEILQLFEAARRPLREGAKAGAKGGTPDETPKNHENQERTMDDEKKMQEALDAQKATMEAQAAEIARLKEANMLRTAGEQAMKALAKNQTLPDATKRRLAISLAKQAPATESGELDVEAFGKLIEAAVTEETAYLAELTGSGQITGLGESQTPDEDPDADKVIEQAEAALEEAFQGLGLGDKAAKIAATSR